MTENGHPRPATEHVLAWVIPPRWGAVAAYLIALLLARLGFIQQMDALPILIAAGVTAATNLIATRVASQKTSVNLATAMLVFDASLLTAVLYATGGASNPLTALYLVQVALAALLLSPRWAWILAGLTAAAFASLFFAPMPHTAEQTHAADAHDAGAFDLHLSGMWLAFVLTAMLVAYFVTRIAGALRAREHQLKSARERAVRAERVAALAGLAAGTAHELSTPLASIVLAAGEMKRSLQQPSAGADREPLVRDLELISEQAKRCRGIIDVMLTEAGDTVGEAPVEARPRELVDQALTTLRTGDLERVRIHCDGGLPALRVPKRLVGQAIGNLLRNAIDASPFDSHVDLEVSHAGQHVRFRIHDRGHGMSAEALATATEPFVSSKGERGLGLGLFLSRTVAERLGGQLTLESEPERGTTATFDIARGT